MTPDQKIKLKEYTRAIAEILYTEGESIELRYRIWALISRSRSVGDLLA
jgi:hypothetical protein